MEKRAAIHESDTENQQEENPLPEEAFLETIDIPREEVEEACENTEDTDKQGLEADILQLKDQLLRAIAETENVRRRAEKQVEDAGKYAVTNFARDLISVLENLYRAGETIQAESLEENPLLKNISEGVEMTKRELLSVFERHGIKRIDPSINDVFDPNLHQAVAQLPSDEVNPGAIVHIMQAGYTIKDRLLRPAMVAVAKEKEAE